MWYDLSHKLFEMQLKHIAGVVYYAHFQHYNIYVFVADIDECLTANNCDQNCIDGVGTYTCGCRDGFTLNNDLRTCRGRLWFIINLSRGNNKLYQVKKFNWTVFLNISVSIQIVFRMFIIFVELTG